MQLIISITRPFDKMIICIVVLVQINLLYHHNREYFIPNKFQRYNQNTKISIVITHQLTNDTDLIRGYSSNFEGIDRPVDRLLYRHMDRIFLIKD